MGSASSVLRVIYKLSSNCPSRLNSMTTKRSCYCWTSLKLPNCGHHVFSTNEWSPPQSLGFVSTASSERWWSRRFHQCAHFFSSLLMTHYHSPTFHCFADDAVLNHCLLPRYSWCHCQHRSQYIIRFRCGANFCSRLRQTCFLSLLLSFDSLPVCSVVSFPLLDLSNNSPLFWRPLLSTPALCVARNINFLLRAFLHPTTFCVELKSAWHLNAAV